MRTNLNVPLVIAFAMLVIAGADPCFAQAPAVPQGPANQQANPKGRQTLDGSVSLSAAYDSDVSGGAPVGATQLFGPEVIAHSNQLLAGAEYRWAARDVQIRANGTSAWLHDRQSGVVTGLSRSAAAGLTARLPGRTTLTLNQTALSSRSNLYNLFPRAAVSGPGTAPPAANDYGASDFDWFSYSTQATLTHDATRRLNLSVTATGELAERVRQSGAEGTPELGSYGMTGRFARALTRDTRATGKYSYRAGTFAGTNSAVTGLTIDEGVRSTEHTVEIGISHGRTLSASRRTVFNVVLGGMVLTPQEQPFAGPIRLTTSYRLVGQAGADYQFRRTWQLGAIYRRGVDYVPGLTEPVFTEGLTGQIGGSFTQRLEVRAGAGYASGTSAFNLGGPTFDTYTSNVRLGFALSRAVSLYGEYLY